MDIPYDAWVLIADGEKFLLLRNEGDEDYPNLQVVGHEEIENPPTREQGTDQPGRYNDAGVGKSAVEQTDWHWLEKERFAKHLAERLHKWAYEDRFSRLIVVAAPKILGVLRSVLHDDVAKRLYGEIDKDLSNHTVEKIEKILKSA